MLLFYLIPTFNLKHCPVQSNSVATSNLVANVRLSVWKYNRSHNLKSKARLESDLLTDFVCLEKGRGCKWDAARRGCAGRSGLAGEDAGRRTRVSCHEYTKPPSFGAV